MSKPPTTAQGVTPEAQQVPLSELRAGALAHYEELSMKAHHWHSVIPRAINAYYDEQERAASSSAQQEPVALVETIRGALQELHSAIDEKMGDSELPDDESRLMLAMQRAAPFLGDAWAAPLPASPTPSWCCVNCSHTFGEHSTASQAAGPCIKSGCECEGFQRGSASPTADTILPDSGEAYRTNAAVRAAVDEIVRSVSELECYTSPDGQPTLLQCTVEELSGILESVLSREVPALPASSATPTDYCHCPLKDENDTGDCERCGKKVEHVFTPALPAASPTAPPSFDAFVDDLAQRSRRLTKEERQELETSILKDARPLFREHQVREAVREALTKLADWMRLEITVAHVGHWIEVWRDKYYPSLPASAEHPT